MPYNARDYYDLDLRRRYWAGIPLPQPFKWSYQIYGEPYQDSNWDGVIVRTFDYFNPHLGWRTQLRGWAQNGGLKVWTPQTGTFGPIGSSNMEIGDYWFTGGHYFALDGVGPVDVYCIENDQWIWKRYPDCLILLEVLNIDTPYEQVQHTWFARGIGKVMTQRFKNRSGEIDFELHASFL